MRDLTGREIWNNAIVAYANDSGFLSLAVVVEVKEKTLQVVKRGYRGEPKEKELIRPEDVLILTVDYLSEIGKRQDVTTPGRPEEIEFVMKYLSEHGR